MNTGSTNLQVITDSSTPCSTGIKDLAYVGPETVIPLPPSTTGVHNQLTGLQGGDSQNRYHLNKVAYDAIRAASTASATNRFVTLSDIDFTTYYTRVQVDQLLSSKASIQVLDAHINDIANPHGVTKQQIGLGNVSNIAPLDLPVSTATQAAINANISPPTLAGSGLTKLGNTIRAGGSLTQDMQWDRVDNNKSTQLVVGPAMTYNQTNDSNIITAGFSQYSNVSGNIGSSELNIKNINKNWSGHIGLLTQSASDELVLRTYNPNTYDDYQSLKFVYDKNIPSLNVMYVIDNVNRKGLEYPTDYAANFTNNSLITKEWSENNMVSVALPQTVTGKKSFTRLATFEEGVTIGVFGSANYNSLGPTQHVMIGDSGANIANMSPTLIGVRTTGANGKGISLQPNLIFFNDDAKQSQLFLSGPTFTASNVGYSQSYQAKDGVIALLSDISGSVIIDPVPTNGSNNAVSSGGTFTALRGKADLEDGRVPASQLPSYVDDVLEFDTLSVFPTPGETGKIYIAKNNNKLYRWSGTSYIDMTQLPTFVIDPTPTNGSANAVSSGGTYTAIDTLRSTVIFANTSNGNKTIQLVNGAKNLIQSASGLSYQDAGGFNTTISFANTIANSILNFPAKAAGSYTIATLSDIPATPALPNIDQVLNQGNVTPKVLHITSADKFDPTQDGLVLSTSTSTAWLRLRASGNTSAYLAMNAVTSTLSSGTSILKVVGTQTNINAGVQLDTSRLQLANAININEAVTLQQLNAAALTSGNGVHVKNGKINLGTEMVPPYTNGAIQGAVYLTIGNPTIDAEAKSQFILTQSSNSFQINSANSGGSTGLTQTVSSTTGTSDYFAANARGATRVIVDAQAGYSMLRAGNTVKSMTDARLDMTVVTGVDPSGNFKTGIVITDQVYSKGLEEVADYSANKTDYSYVTKIMQTNALSSKADLVGGQVPVNQLPDASLSPDQFATISGGNLIGIRTDYLQSLGLGGSSTVIFNNGSVVLTELDLNNMYPSLASGSAVFQPATGKLYTKYVISSATQWWITSPIRATTGKVTPSAPTNFIVDDANNTGAFTNTGGLTNADTEVTFNAGGSTSPNTLNPFNVPDSNFPINTVGVRYKETSDRSPSAWLFNQTPYTGVAPVYYLPGFTALNIMNGVVDKMIDNGNGTYSAPMDNPASVTTKYLMPHLSEIAIPVTTDSNVETYMGLVSAYEIRNGSGIVLVGSTLYQSSDGERTIFTPENQVTVGDWVIVRYSGNTDNYSNRELLVFKTTDGTNYTQLALPGNRMNYVNSPNGFVSFGATSPNTKVLYPQGKGLTLST